MDLSIFDYLFTYLPKQILEFLNIHTFNGAFLGFWFVIFCIAGVKTFIKLMKEAKNDQGTKIP